MKVVFIGLCPPPRLPSKALDKLKDWCNKIGVTSYMVDNVFDEFVEWKEHNSVKPGPLANFRKKMYKYEGYKIIAFSRLANTYLHELNIRHLQITPPSTRNKNMTAYKMEHFELDKMKKYIFNENKSAYRKRRWEDI